MIDINELRQSLGAVQPEEVAALLDRLEAAEKERDELRARIEAKERQEPAGWIGRGPRDGRIEFSTHRPAPSVMRDFNVKPLYLAPGAQPAPSIPDGWLRAIDEALVVAHIGVANASDTYEQAKVKLNNLICFHTDIAADAASRLPGPDAASLVWLPIPEKHPTFDLVDLRLADGSVLCECVPQSDGDYWWRGPSGGEFFIDPRYAQVTHWRLAAAPEAKP